MTAKDVHSCVADLIGDRERRRRQHEMRQDFHATLGEHEIGENDASEAYHANKIVDGMHFCRSNSCGRAQLSLEPFPSLDCEPKT
jgi:hypothetical protein